MKRWKSGMKSKTAVGFLGLALGKVCATGPAVYE